VAGGDIGQILHSRRVFDRESLPGGRRPPLVINEEVGLHFPLNSAIRFSWFAAIPSLASSLWNSCCCNSRSMARPLSNGTSAPDCTERLINPTALDALCGGQNCWWSSRTCS